MLSFSTFCHVLFLQIFLIHCDETSTDPGPTASGLEAGASWSVEPLSSPAVLRLSVPEDHHLCLWCGSSDVVWTHEHREVPVIQQRLCLLQLDDSDDGEYRCNGQLVAELQVLTGHDFVVSAGRTLLLPCSSSDKPKQRWFHRRKRGRREPIFTRYQNGTVKHEREGNRLSFSHNALQILNLQPEDAGEYQCRELKVRLTVRTAPPRPTSIQSSAATAAAPTEPGTDVVEKKKKKKKNGEANALLLVAAVSVGIMILLLAAVYASLTSMRCRKRKKRRAAQSRDDTELQPWTTTSEQTEYEVLASSSVPEETVHYASLGRQNLGERPSRSPPAQGHHDVIYSSVVTRPAAR